MACNATSLVYFSGTKLNILDLYHQVRAMVCISPETVWLISVPQPCREVQYTVAILIFRSPFSSLLLFSKKLFHIRGGWNIVVGDTHEVAISATCM